jgi:hypothetical protein
LNRAWIHTEVKPLDRFFDSKLRNEEPDMKKVLFAFLLGLTAVSSIIDLATPVSAPDEEPKPRKPEGE